MIASTAAAAAGPTANPGALHRLSLDVAAACNATVPTGLRGWSARRARHAAAVRAVRLAVDSLAVTHDDEALRTLLVEVLNQVRRRHGLPAVPPLNRAAVDCREVVPVRSELRIPGGDSTYLHCAAVLDDWPDWLRDPWLERHLRQPRAQLT